MATDQIQQNKDFYENMASEYDRGMDWLFQSFGENENLLRERMIDLLELEPSYRVLEVGAGTCRDSIEIVKRLGAKGAIFCNDLSPNMLKIGQARLRKASPQNSVKCATEFFIGDATHLPFPDGYFDAVYHFGGLNLFAGIKQSIEELTRVARVGAKIVIGDESVPPWLRDTQFGKILMNSNPLYRHQLPLSSLPPNAREVCIRWILGNVFYLIDYRVGEGLPPLDLDLVIPGRRGGTHRTRYYGAIDGVTPETRKRMEEAASAEGISFHDWLERAVRASLPGDTE